MYYPLSYTALNNNRLDFKTNSMEAASSMADLTPPTLSNSTATRKLHNNIWVFPYPLSYYTTVYRETVLYRARFSPSTQHIHIPALNSARFHGVTTISDMIWITKVAFSILTVMLILNPAS